jgi:hypothetical protein
MKQSFLLFALGLFCLSWSANATDFTLSAVPTRVDLTPVNGFMIYGAFGNPNNCSGSDTVFVKDPHPQYKMIYSSVANDALRPSAPSC